MPLALAASAIVVIALAVWWFGFHAQQAVGDRRVLVMPLEVRGQSEGAEYAGRAVAEAIAINLAQAQGLSVLPVPDRTEVEGSGTARLRSCGADAGG